MNETRQNWVNRAVRVDRGIGPGMDDLSYSELHDDFCKPSSGIVQIGTKSMLKMDQLFLLFIIFLFLVFWGRGVPKVVFGEHGVGWIGGIGIVPDEILRLIFHD